MSQDDDMFGSLLEDQETNELEEEMTGPTRQPYKLAVQRPASRLQASASEDDLFGLGDDGIVPLDELYTTIDDIVSNLKGSNGLTSVSTFSGCSGSVTGFAWGGWNELLACEFVDAARDTLHENYPSYVITPEDVTEIAADVAKEMNFSSDVSGDDVEVHDNVARPVVLFNRKRKIRGKAIPSSIDWESTIEGMVQGDFDEELKAFMYEVNIRCFAKHGTVEKMGIWGDDIRGFDPKAFMDFKGLKEGELDCFEGSPPCKSFSTSGLREKGWGKRLHYSDERDQRTDDLFVEYVRVLTAFMPKSFLAENVAGMKMGAAERDVMIPLMKAFDDLGYRVEVREMNSVDYGVPQSRPRVFFMGIRKDMVLDNGQYAQPEWPDQMEYRYTCQNALDAAEEHNTEAYLKHVQLENRVLNKETGEREDYETARIWKILDEGSASGNKAFQMIRCHSKLPVPTVTATGAGNVPAAGPSHPHEPRKFTIPELKYIFSFPIDYKFTGTLDQQGERMGRSVTPYMMKQIAETLAGILKRSHSDESMTFND